MREENEYYDLHALLVILWSRLNGLLRDLVRQQQKDNDRQTINVNNEKLWPKIRDILKETLDGDQPFIKLRYFYRSCLVCSQPSLFCIWYYLNIFNKSRLWRKYCYIQHVNNGYFFSCFAFKFCQFLCFLVGISTLCVLVLKLFA